MWSVSVTEVCRLSLLCRVLSVLPKSVVAPRSIRVTEVCPCYRGLSVSPRSVRVTEVCPCYRGLSVLPRSVRVTDVGSADVGRFGAAPAG